MDILKNFEEYEAYKIGDLTEQLSNLMGVAVVDGELIGFDGEFYDGERGNDHNIIKSGLDFDTWDDLHNAIAFVRLVPESMIALVSGLCVDDDILNTIKEFGYTIEEY
jgi:alpha-acetolactate decarboxylase